MTKLVAIVTNFSELKTAKRLLNSGVDLIELRIDWFNSIQQSKLIDILKSMDINFRARTICTARQKAEGGRGVVDGKYSNDGEAVRLEIYKKFIPLCGYVDIELNSKILVPVNKTAKTAKKKVIVSYHNFSSSQVSNNRLHKIFLSAKRLKPEIIKIAVYIRDFAQLRKYVEFFREHSEGASGRAVKLAFIPMSKEISFARYLFMCLGSAITYGYIERPVAPGQLPIANLIKFNRLINSS